MCSSAHQECGNTFILCISPRSDTASAHVYEVGWVDEIGEWEQQMEVCVCVCVRSKSNNDDDCQWKRRTMEPSALLTRVLCAAVLHTDPTDAPPVLHVQQ